MASLIVEMGVDDRVCFVKKGKRTPYCILRVLGVVLTAPESVEFWLSLHRKPVKLIRGEETVVEVDDWKVTVKFLKPKRNSKAALRFEADREVKIKPLRHMEQTENYRDKEV